MNEIEPDGYDDMTQEEMNALLNDEEYNYSDILTDEEKEDMGLTSTESAPKMDAISEDEQTFNDNKSMLRFVFQDILTGDLILQSLENDKDKWNGLWREIYHTKFPKDLSLRMIMINQPNYTIGWFETIFVQYNEGVTYLKQKMANVQFVNTYDLTNKEEGGFRYKNDLDLLQEEDEARCFELEEDKYGSYIYNGRHYSEDELLGKTESVMPLFDGQIADFYGEDGIQYVKKTNPAGIKVDPFLSAVIGIDTYEEGYSNWLFLGKTNWIGFNNESRLWTLYKSDGEFLDIVGRYWNKFITERKKQHSYSNITKLYKIDHAICTEDKITEQDLTNKDLISMINGAYDWKTTDADKRFRLIKKSDFIYSTLPVNYKPNYKTDNIYNYIISAFLEGERSSKINKLLLKTLKLFVGLSMRGYNIERFIMFLIGHDTGTGKGTITTLLTNIIGNDNIFSKELKNWNKPFGMQESVGKHLLICPETNDSKLPNVDILKTISGNDPFNIQRKNIDAVFSPHKGHILIQANSIGSINFGEVAIWDRMYVFLLNKGKIFTELKYRELMLQAEEQDEMDNFANECLSLIPDVYDILEEYRSMINVEALYEKNNKQDKTTYDIFNEFLTAATTNDFYVFNHDLQWLENLWRKMEYDMKPINYTDRKQILKFTNQLTNYLRKTLRKPPFKDRRRHKYVNKSITCFGGIRLKLRSLEDYLSQWRDDLDKETIFNFENLIQYNRDIQNSTADEYNTYGTDSYEAMEKLIK